MGDGGFFGGFDPGGFFSGIIDTLVEIINAIISALVYLFNLLVAVFQFLYAALVAIANVLVAAVKVIARGFIHVLSDIVHGRFLHLFQDYLDLKKKLTELLAPVLRILHTIKKIFDQYVTAPLLRFINMIQKLRQFLTIFRILGFKWAKKLDTALANWERRVVQNVLVLQAWINFAISAVSLIMDPSLIMRKNFLLASLLSFLGAVKRVVFFGANRTPSSDETKQAQQDKAALSHTTHLIQSGFGSTAVYYPTVQTINDRMNGMLANYASKGTLV
jgi:hypothetical protein